MKTPVNYETADESDDASIIRLWIILLLLLLSFKALLFLKVILNEFNAIKHLAIML